MWIFIDTECQVDKQVVFTWITLFQEFKNKKLQFLLQNDPNTEFRKSIYKNIVKSRLQREASSTLVLPCLDVIEWITRRVDHENKTIINFKDENVANYQASVLVSCITSNKLMSKLLQNG